MSSFSGFISRRRVQLQSSFCREGLVLRGDGEWTDTRLHELCDAFSGFRCVQLSGLPRSGYEWIEYKQGHHLLGQECHLLVVDLSQGFNADSFNAVLGTLVGSGLLVFIHEPDTELNNAQVWLRRALDQLLVIKQHAPLPLLDASYLPIKTIGAFGHPEDQCGLPLHKQQLYKEQRYKQQEHVIESIIHVVEGHRKRPLVMIADRGRGKSSALGIAAARLMQRRPSFRIIVTAPSYQAVQPIFTHAISLLDGAVLESRELTWHQTKLVFIPPDELLKSRFDADLMLVDEASSIPVPMLQHLGERYNRIVFSTTVHGYEGCGRGFVLKFIEWLRSFRPQFRQAYLSQPIRWAVNDPLEVWQYRTFLLNAELPSVPQILQYDAVRYRYVDRTELLNTPDFLANIFALLTHAHYQTSPNDLMSILSDPMMSVFIAEQDGGCLGCILAIREGGLSAETVERIQRGVHRPKGQLVPTTLTNQLGFSDAGAARCCRIMRIVVHPQLQRKGLGSQLLNTFIQYDDTDYFATSFGASEALLNFWHHHDFHPIKLGSRRDQSSGCYSILMVRQCLEPWLEPAKHHFSYYFIHTLKTEFSQLEPAIVRQLLFMLVPHSCTVPINLIYIYTRGGANYESVAIWIQGLIGQYTKQVATIVSDLLIMKVLQNNSWSEVAMQLNFRGRRDIEIELRRQVADLLLNLQCK